MLTVGKLIEMLGDYPKDMPVTSQLNEQFIHIVNQGNDLILSTESPKGECKRCGEYVYPTPVSGYSAYCPWCDEDLLMFEFSPATT